MSEIDEIYLSLCKRLLTSQNVRNTKEMNNVQICLEDINQNIVSVRGISPSYLFGEWLWYFTGRNDMKFISKYGAMWEKLSDDGITNNSAYGYLMQKAFGFNQVEKIIDLLSEDPTSRRAVINLNTPNKNVIETKDEPCTIALQFLIRNNKLYCTTMMRSNDIWLGFPYDVAFFTELQKYIADRLEIAYGSYTHFVVSMHLYDRNYEEVKNIVAHPIPKPFVFDRKAFHKRKEFVAEMIAFSIDHESKNVKEITLDLARDYFDYMECGICRYWNEGKCMGQKSMPTVKCLADERFCEDMN